MLGSAPLIRGNPIHQQRDQLQEPKQADYGLMAHVDQGTHFPMVNQGSVIPIARLLAVVSQDCVVTLLSTAAVMTA